MTGSFPRPFLRYIRSEHNGFCTKTNENEFISRQAKCIQRLHPSLSPEVYIKFSLSYLLQLYQLGLRQPATAVGWLWLRNASGTGLPLDWKETRPTTVHYRDKRIGDMSSSVVEKWWVFSSACCGLAVWVVYQIMRFTSNLLEKQIHLYLHTSWTTSFWKYDFSIEILVIRRHKVLTNW